MTDYSDAQHAEIERIIEKHSGWVNKLLFRQRKRAKHKFTKGVLDYYFIGGMTTREQEEITDFLGEPRTKFTKGNILIEPAVTIVIFAFPIGVNYLVNLVTNSDANAGHIVGYGSISWSIVLNAGRAAYTYSTGRPCAAFSIPAIAGNVWTWGKRGMYLMKEEVIEKRGKYADFVLGSQNYHEFERVKISTLDDAVLNPDSDMKFKKQYRPGLNGKDVLKQYVLENEHQDV